jgi:hypothetical protein
VSVVVSEFEVVPAAPEQGAQPAPQAAAAEPQIDVQREIERALDLQRQRAARLHAD